MALIYQTPFSDEDLEIVSEALHSLLGVKQEALKTVNTAGLLSTHRPRVAFTEADFGIPKIRALIQAVRDRMSDDEEEPAQVEQTSCKHCGQDIENFHPFRNGEWRDRGNNTTCPNESGKKHAPPDRVDGLTHGAPSEEEPQQ